MLLIVSQEPAAAFLTLIPMEQIALSAMDIRALALQDRQHRRGSLPLKKRIFSYTPQASPVVLKDDSFPGTDETLAALALIQAAASGSPAQRFQYPVRVPELPLLPHMERENDAKISLLSLHSRAFVHDVAAAVPFNISKDPDIDLTIDPPGNEEDTVGLSASASSDSTSDSISSYGLYNDDHKFQGRAAPASSPGRRTIHLQAVEQDEGAAEGSRQNKRFTGLRDEVCCIATTTRGRACAYVAVQGTSFCNLHLHHAPAAKQQTALGAVSMPSRRKKPEKEQFETESTCSSKLLPSPLVNLSLQKKPRGRRASKLAETHAESPYFLLSMIPSDQWYGKYVAILTGPMKDQEGCVEKWSNGWVTVRIPGAGVHNRRSIELAIVKKDDQEKPSRKKPVRAYSSKKTIALPRDKASPSPLSDLDSYHCQDPALLRTPRTLIAEGKEPLRTPMSQVFYASVANVTPGSTVSAFDMPLSDVYRGSRVVKSGNPSHGRGGRSIDKPDRVDEVLDYEASRKRPALGQAPPTTYKKHRALEGRAP